MSVAPEDPPKVVLPEARKLGQDRSGKMAASVLTQKDTIAGFEEQMNPETVWTEGDGEMLIDWEGSVCLSEISWEESMERKLSESVKMMLYVGLQGAPRDDDVTSLFQLSLKGAKAGKRIYVDPESDAADKIITYREGGPGNTPVNARVRWNKQFQCPEVTEIIHRNWIDLERYRNLFQ